MAQSSRWRRRRELWRTPSQDCQVCQIGRLARDKRTEFLAPPSVSRRSNEQVRRSLRTRLCWRNTSRRRRASQACEAIVPKSVRREGGSIGSRILSLEATRGAIRRCQSIANVQPVARVSNRNRRTHNQRRFHAGICRYIGKSRLQVAFRELRALRR